MFARIDHIGVAVEDLDAALALYEGRLDLALVHREVVEEQGVEAVLLDVGENHVELLRPARARDAGREVPGQAGPGPAPRRLPGARHRGRARRARGPRASRCIDETPRTGIRGSRVAFLHPRSTGGVLTEIVQPAEGH